MAGGDERSQTQALLPPSLGDGQGCLCAAGQVVDQVALSVHSDHLLSAGGPLTAHLFCWGPLAGPLAVLLGPVLLVSHWDRHPLRCRVELALLCWV